MKLVVGVLAIAAILVSGCAVVQVPFKEKGRFLALSRRAIGSMQHEYCSKPVVEYDFGAECEMSAFKVLEGSWTIKDGALTADAGKRNRAILIARGLKGPLRVELEVTNYANLDGSLGDITILIGADDEFKSFFSSGYALTTGSYYNNCTTFYRLGQPIANTEYSPLVSGKKYKVVVDYVDGHIRYWLNGEIILEAWDSAPLIMNSNCWIGVRTWNTKMDINHFAVYN